MRYIVFTIILFFVHCLNAQQYTFRQLTQEPVKKTKTPQIAPIPKDWGDTSVTTYSGGSIEILHYFVNGDQYDNIFNPNPTGLYLNGQPFTYFCDTEKEYRQSVSMPAEIFEFSYTGRNFLLVMSLRESNTESKYKCYNLFDITNPKKIFQTSFPSIHTGEDAFGDFNFDNVMDFLVVVMKKPETFVKKIAGAYTVYAYTFTPEGVTKQLMGADNREPAYIFGKGDDNMEKFVVLQHDWFIPLKDSSGVALTKNNIYKPYRPFEVKDDAIYDENGVKREKKKYSILLGMYDDDGGARELVSELKTKKIGVNGHGFDTFIMFDQYGPSGIKWLVLVGNYMTKVQAQKALDILRQHGYTDAKIRDLTAQY